MLRFLAQFFPLSIRIRIRDRRAKRLLANGQPIPENVFSQIYVENKWGNAETVSGPGSQKEVAKQLINPLNEWMNQLHVQTLLDLPCGDCNWIFELDLTNRQYIGGDIVPELIGKNRMQFVADNRTFYTLNVVSDELPQADLLLCRDCFVHLSNELIMQSLKHIGRSGIRYVALTHFPDFPRNYDIPTGQWRPVNLQLPPFNLPEPEAIIEEWSPEGTDPRYRKVLALWERTVLS